MSPNRAIASGESNFSSPLAAAQPLAALSWPVTLKASGSRRASRMAMSEPQCPMLHIIDPLGPDAYREAKGSAGLAFSFFVPECDITPARKFRILAHTNPTRQRGL
jgi:hypothetical protein